MKQIKSLNNLNTADCESIITCFTNFNNEDLMLIITFVYVIATIFICYANFRSAEETRRQTQELQRQFAEVHRPQIDVTIELDSRENIGMKFANSGEKYAYDISIEIKWYDKNIDRTFDDFVLECVSDNSFLRIFDSSPKKFFWVLGNVFIINLIILTN